EWSVATTTRRVIVTRKHLRYAPLLCGVRVRMTNRSRLKCHVNEAWRRTICNEYHGRQINNEAALQAHFVKHLEAVFSEQEVERRIFIEPPFKLQGRDELPRNRIPDI